MKLFEDKVKHQVYNRVCIRVGGVIACSVIANIFNKVRSGVKGQVMAHCWSNIWNQVRDEISHK